MCLYDAAICKGIIHVPHYMKKSKVKELKKKIKKKTVLTEGSRNWSDVLLKENLLGKAQ